ncbi:putative virion structural protein [Pseudomonas phage OBP]|uniref:head maturation protease n=1 Tax=Pseudomonas phage OBP TaxID=1124849 RepID=UPI000240D636|nr:head maturation protease [Pseudomonas phage OBP]AEV89720.1 putative virion structural protein [Pseudomonas phage OBP]
MSQISLGNIILAGTGKKGILAPEANGTYLLNAGGFNIPNHAGITYPANEYVLDQINENSDLQRRVKMGYCKMEVEHPEPFIYVIENGVKYRQPITDVLQWINRLRSYDPANICGLISEVLFNFDNPNDVRAPIWNLIRCEPFGPRREEFRESLANPRHNTAVSIRTQISPFRPGDTQKNVEFWTGYDWVSEPGMVHANKHMTAGCESFLNDFGLNDNMQKFSTSEMIERLDGALAEADKNAEALIRVGGMEALDDYRQILGGIKAKYSKGDSIIVGKSFTDIF